MSLRSPKKRDIQVGKSVDVYDGEGTRRGRAKLIRRRPSRYKQDNLGYVKKQVKHCSGDEDDVPPEDSTTNKGPQKPTLYIWSSERWEVEWEEHSYYRPGDRNCTEVHFYVCTTTDYPSFVDVNTIGNKGVAAEGLYIFIEEEGVLPVENGKYKHTAVKALERIKRSIDGEVVLYTHNPAQAKERWELSKIPFRIFDFLTDAEDALEDEELEENTQETAIKKYQTPYARAILSYVEKLDDQAIEDYIIISGVSRVIGDRVIQTDIKKGLQLKQKSK